MGASYSLVDSATVLVAGDADWVRGFTETLEAQTTAGVKRAETQAAALDVLEGDGVDCVLSGYAVGDATGIELLRAVRAETGTLPVLLCTAAGSEAIASDAIAAGVSEYVALADPCNDRFADVLERVELALRTAQRTET